MSLDTLRRGFREISGDGFRYMGSLDAYVLESRLRIRTLPGKRVLLRYSMMDMKYVVENFSSWRWRADS